MKENTGAVHAQVPVDVATYLLNEKRAEFHSIESRLKVNVVLIPNIHLETPNYTVTRLKHEDLNQADAPPPSYEMVAMPEKTGTELPSAQTEPAIPRQEAAVKGITPAQPAPIVEHKAKPEAAATAPQSEPSIISKIFGWFQRGQPEAKAAAPELVPRERSERAVRGPRPERGPRRGRPNLPQRNEHRRDEPGERAAQLQQAGGASADSRAQRHETRGRGAESRDSRPPREHSRREGQTQRPQRPPRVESPPAEAGTVPAQPREPGQRHDSEGRGRGRRRRGGRDRFEPRDGQHAPQRADAIADSADVVMSATGVTTNPAPGAEPRPAPPVESAPSPSPAEALPMAPVEEIRRFEPTPMASVAAPAAELAPERPHVPAVPSQPAVSEPVVLPPSLELVETSPEKLRLAASNVEPPHPPRPPRVRQPLAPVTEEPLVQIETASNRESAGRL